MQQQQQRAEAFLARHGYVVKTVLSRGRYGIVFQLDDSRVVAKVLAQESSDDLAAEFDALACVHHLAPGQTVRPLRLLREQRQTAIIMSFAGQAFASLPVETRGELEPALGRFLLRVSRRLARYRLANIDMHWNNVLWLDGRFRVCDVDPDFLVRAASPCDAEAMSLCTVIIRYGDEPTVIRLAAARLASMGQRARELLPRLCAQHGLFAKFCQTMRVTPDEIDMVINAT